MAVDQGNHQHGKAKRHEERKAGRGWRAEARVCGFESEEEGKMGTGVRSSIDLHSAGRARQKWVGR